MNKIFINRTFFSFFHLLDDDLLCRLGRNTSKRRCIHLDSQAIPDLTFGIIAKALFIGQFNIRILNIFNNFFKLKDINFAGFIIIMNFNVRPWPQFLSGS